MEKGRKERLRTFRALKVHVRVCLDSDSARAQFVAAWLSIPSASDEASDQINSLETG